MDVWLSHFHFLRPWMFFIILPMLWLLYVAKKQSSSLSAWQKVCDPALLSYLKVGVETSTAKRSFWTMFIAGLLIITALAGPVWKQLPQPMYRQQSALVVLLDLSRSMDAGDVKPSRLTRAKQKLTDLLKLRREGQAALVVFAGSAFVVTPLTDDFETILSQLQSLSTDMMPKQGGNIDIALAKATDLFSQAGVPHGEALLLTDSDMFSDTEVNKLTAAGHRLTVIGVGTVAGAPIPKASGGFLTDIHGNIVVPKLNTSQLKTLARQGHGLYQPLSLDNSDIQSLLAASMLPDATKSIIKNGEENKQISDQWQEEGPWLLLLVIPLVLMGFRRGVLVVALFLCLPSPPAEAGAWQDMWQTKNQQGEALMQQKQYEQATSTFNDPAWKAAAAYRNQGYETALNALETINKPSADDLYNKGNALAQLGRVDEAIAAYDAALGQDKTHADALANKTLLEKQKKEEDKKKDSKKDSKKDDKQDQSEKDKSDQQKSDQQKSEQQKSEQQKAEQQKAEQQKAEQKKAEQKKAEQKKAEKPSKQDLEKTEAQQELEQTLRRIPDDPGGLLRRKFLYQYKQQASPRSSGEDQW